jgi:hypothetical protein
MATITLEPVPDDGKSHDGRLHLRPSPALTAAAAPRHAHGAPEEVAPEEVVRRYVVPLGASHVSGLAPTIAFPPLLQRANDSGSCAVSELRVRVACLVATRDDSASDGAVSYILVGAVDVAPSLAAVHGTGGGSAAPDQAATALGAFRPRLCRLCDVQLELNLLDDPEWRCSYCYAEQCGFGAFMCPVCSLSACNACLEHLDAA